MSSCIFCGCVASPEPEYKDTCPDCVSIMWDSLQGLTGSNLSKVWESECFPETKNQGEIYQDFLSSLLSGLPEALNQLDENPSLAIQLKFDKGLPHKVKE